MLSMFASDQPSHFRTYSPKGQARAASWHCKTHADSDCSLLLASVAALWCLALPVDEQPFLEQVALMDALGFA